MLSQYFCKFENFKKEIIIRLRLCRKRNYSNFNQIIDFITYELSKSGQLYVTSYMWMHHKCLQQGLVVRQNTVRELLKVIDPIGAELRTRWRLRIRQYSSKEPDYLWHINSYYKLKPFGIAINGCIDGYSRHVMWLKAGSTSIDQRVIGGPRIIRTDIGTENIYWTNEIFFSRYIPNDSIPPYISGSSNTAIIECWWSI